MYCIYRENEVSANIVQQVRLFKEDIDGKPADIFPNNQAIIEHTENRFFIRTLAGELLFIADNIDHAIEKTRQAEPSAIITFVNNGTGYDEAEYIQKTAPIIYRVGLTALRSTETIFAYIVADKGTERLHRWKVSNVTESELVEFIQSLIAKSPEPNNTQVELSHGHYEELEEYIDNSYDNERYDFSYLLNTAKKLKENYREMLKDGKDTA